MESKVSRPVLPLSLAGLLLIGILLPLAGTFAVDGAAAGAPLEADSSPRHDLPIAVTLTLLDGGDGSALASLSAHIVRLAYEEEALVRLLVTPEGVGQLIAGDWNGTLPAGEDADLSWDIQLLQGAQVSCHVVTSRGSLLGGDGLVMAGGPAPVPTLGEGPFQASTTAWPVPAAPTATIGLSYTLCFLGETGNATYPCRYAYYELWSKVGTVESRVGSGHADGNGIVNLTGISSGNLSLRFWANDDLSCKVDAGGSIGTVYSWTSEYAEIISNQDFTVTVDDPNRGVWAAYTNVQDAYDWLRTETGWSRSQVRIQWPVGTWPQSDGDSIYLTTVGAYSNSVWGREVVLHEYAHCIQHVLPGGWPPWSWAGSHYIYTESDPGFALLEGWAEFFPCAVDNVSEFMGYDLESYQFADVLSNGDWDGEIVEGAVAAILWDIFDGVSLADHASYELSGYGDRIDSEFVKFWAIFSTDRPEGIGDIWSNWSPMNVDLWAIFYNSRMDMDGIVPTNPTGTVTDPASDAWSDGMEVTVALTGASDDLSGVRGFHYRWASAGSDPTGVLFCEGTSITSELVHGEWVLSVCAVDRSGRAAAGWTSFAFYSDAVPPSNPDLVTSDHPLSKWSKMGTITMQWSGAGDDLSGVKGYSIVLDRSPATLPDATLDTASSNCSFNVGDGTWYFHLRTVDMANNWAATAVHMGPFWIDIGLPALEASPTGNIGLEGIYVSAISLSISASDARSGIDQIEYREGSDPWAPYGGPILVTGDGAHVIYARATDLAGNSETLTIDLRIDTTAPTAPSAYESIIAAGVWSNASTINVRWWGMEDEGGISGYSYLLSAVPSELPDEILDSTSASIDELALPEGTWYLHVRSADRAGHFSVGALSIGPFMIDREVPSTILLVLEQAPESGWYTGPVPFTLSASDSRSGLRAIEMRLDGGEWTIMTGDFAFAQEGRHTLEYRSSDLAGNLEEVASYEISIDMTPPAPPLDFMSSLAIGRYAPLNQTALSWSGAWDEASGVTGYRLAIGSAQSGAPLLGELQTGNSSELFLQEGIWSIYVWSVDCAGWTSMEPLVMGPFMVDTIAPSEVLMTAEGTRGTDGWYRSEVSVAMNAADERSGIGAYEISMDGIEWTAQPSPLRLTAEGRYDIWARAVDGAGNRGPVAMAQFGLDMTAPTTVANTEISPRGGWFDRAVTVQLGSSDALSGAALYSRLDRGEWQEGVDTMIIGEGVHELSFYSVDGAGNIENTSIWSIQVDVSAPIIEGLSSDPIECFDSAPLPLRLTASVFDIWSGLDNLSFAIRFGEGDWSEDLAAEPGPGSSYAVQIPWRTWMAQVGTQLTWMVKANDALGHGSFSTAAIAISDDDVLPPEAPSIDPGADYSLSIRSSDQSGWAVDLWYFFSNTPGEIHQVLLSPDVDGNAIFVLDMAALIAHLGSEINWRLQLRDLDADRTGDSSARAITEWAALGPIVDETPPQSRVTLGGTRAGAWYTTLPTMSIVSTDNMSGLKTIWVQVDEEARTEYAGVMVLSDGVHRVQVYAEDVSGNLEEPQDFEVQVDTVPPQAEGTLSTPSSSGSWRNLTTFFSIVASDAGSGIGRLEYCIDAGAWTSYSSPVQLGDGRHVLRYQAEDAAGNALAPQELQANIDHTCPELRLEVEVGDGIRVNASAADVMSGMAYLALLVDGQSIMLPLNSSWSEVLHLSPGTHTIELEGIDVAGNEAARSAEVVVPADPMAYPSLIIVAAVLALTAVVVVAMVLRWRRR